MDIAESFVLGWSFGHARQTELTAAEIAERFPDADPDALAQGCIDGLLNDRFRLESVAVNYANHLPM